MKKHACDWAYQRQIDPELRLINKLNFKLSIHEAVPVFIS